MRNPEKWLRLGILGVLLVLLIVAMIIPVKVPYSVKANAQVVPAREWILARGTDGRLVTSLYDHARGRTESYAVSQFEREDAMRFSIRENITGADFVAEGDTIGSVFSSQAQRLLTQLSGELAVDEASLAFYSTGEKAAIIEAAQEELALAREQVATQEKVAARLETLSSTAGAVSAEEVDIAIGQLRVYEKEVGIASAKLRAAQSGAKPEQISLIRAQMNAKRAEIEALSQRLDNFTVISPVSGPILRSGSSDTLLVIGETSSLVLNIPVDPFESDQVRSGQSIELMTGDDIEGKVIGVEPIVRSVGGREFVLISGLISEQHVDMPRLGAVVKARIQIDEVTLRDYLKRSVSRLLK